MGINDILCDYKIFDIDLYKLRSKNFHKDMIIDREKLLTKYSGLLKSERNFSCTLCESKVKEHFVSYKQYALYECKNCSAISPNIDLSNLMKSGIHNSGEILEDLKRELISTFEYRKKTFACERLQYLKEKIHNFDAVNHNILDVGCGPGYFLSHLKDQKINSKGLELNSFCVEFCQNNGLNVSSNELKSETDNNYSIITLFDVLEHLPNPIRFFEEANKKLIRGGHILAFTPNIHSVSLSIMKGQHNMISVFNHLCFFSKKALEHLAENSGFKIVSIDCYGLDIMDYLSMKEAEDEYPYFEKLNKMVSVLQAIIDKSQIGNSLRVVFQKI